MATKRKRKRRKGRSRARSSVDRRQLIPVLMAVLLIVIILLIMGINYLVKKYSPSDERMDLHVYFNLEEGDGAAVILENELTEIQARMIEIGRAHV